MALGMTVNCSSVARVPISMCRGNLWLFAELSVINSACCVYMYMPGSQWLHGWSYLLPVVVEGPFQCLRHLVRYLIWTCHLA
jgi:hypothetical protein